MHEAFACLASHAGGDAVMVETLKSEAYASTATSLPTWLKIGPISKGTLESKPLSTSRTRSYVMWAICV